MSKATAYLAKATAKQGKVFAKAQKKSRKNPNTLNFADTLAQVSTDTQIDKKDLNRLLTSTDARSTPTFVLDSLGGYFAGKPGTTLDKKASKMSGLRIGGEDVLYKPKRAKMGAGLPPFEETFYDTYKYVGNNPKQEQLPSVPNPYEEIEMEEWQMPDYQMPDYNTNMSMPDPQYMAGGIGSAVDGGATGFRRKKSSARTAGMTSKGTGQLKVSGQNSRSSGLNIGI